MQRRGVTIGLLTSAAGTAVLVPDAQAQTCTAPCYSQTAAELAAGVTPTNLSFLPGNVRRYGAIGDGSTNNTTAFANAIAQALRAGGSAVFVPGGNYVVAITFANTVVGLRMYGESAGLSFLTAVNGTTDVITCAAGTSIWGVTIQDLTLLGSAASTTGNGIRIPAGIAFAFSLRFQNLVLRGFGNSGIYDQKGAFSTMVENVQISDCGSHAFDFLGGNTLSFVNCYAMTVATGTGKAGYRVHSGRPIFQTCNGLNGGDYWGIFSDIPAEDNANNYCAPTLIGCNVEDFSVAGIYNKLTGLTSIRTVYLANHPNVIAIKIVPSNHSLFGELDNNLSFLISGDGQVAGSWRNGYPVHTALQSIAPFVTVSSGTGDDTFTWYDELEGTTASMSTTRTTRTRIGRFAATYKDLYVSGTFRTAYASTAVLSGGSTVVTFGTPLPDTAYVIVLSGSANETFYWAVKGITGFTIKSSNPNSTAAVDWKVELAQ